MGKGKLEPEEVMGKVRSKLGKGKGNPDGKEDGMSSLEGAINEKSDAINLEGKKIVWVEDDQFLNDIIARKLATTKCSFFHSNEGVEALKIINTELPDIVMLDILLAGMDGFEILRRIKSDPKTKNIPVILLSNLGQQSDIEKGKSLGAARFLVKATVTPNEILEQIREVLAEKKK